MITVTRNQILFAVFLGLVNSYIIWKPRFEAKYLEESKQKELNKNENVRMNKSVEWHQKFRGASWVCLIGSGAFFLTMFYKHDLKPAMQRQKREQSMQDAQELKDLKRSLTKDISI